MAVRRWGRPERPVERQDAGGRPRTALGSGAGRGGSAALRPMPGTVVLGPSDGSGRLLGRLAPAGRRGPRRRAGPRARKPRGCGSRRRWGPEYRSSSTTAATCGLVTVCEEAGCPNIYECWADGTATFMINGDRCTRACGFCQVDTPQPLPLDPGEPGAGGRGGRAAWDWRTPSSPVWPETTWPTGAPPASPPPSPRSGGLRRPPR